MEYNENDMSRLLATVYQGISPDSNGKIFSLWETKDGNLVVSDYEECNADGGRVIHAIPIPVGVEEASLRDEPERFVRNLAEEDSLESVDPILERMKWGLLDPYSLRVGHRSGEVEILAYRPEFNKRLFWLIKEGPFSVLDALSLIEKREKRENYFSPPDFFVIPRGILSPDVCRETIWD